VVVLILLLSNVIVPDSKPELVFTCSQYFVAPLVSFHSKVIVFFGGSRVGAAGGVGTTVTQPASSPRTPGDVKPVPAEAGKSEEKDRALK
jgi:hypothetical protein